MKRHNYVERVGPRGNDDWQCVAVDCRDRGPLHALLARPCKHDVAPGGDSLDLRAAIDCALERTSPQVH